MTMPSKKLLMILAPALVVVLGIIAAVGFWMTTPQRTVDAFLTSVKSGNKEAAMAFVSSDTTAKKRENIQWFVDDWTEGKTFSWTKIKDASWRSQADGTDAKGKAHTVTLPTTKYLAHNYQAFVNVTFDEFEDPVIIVLERNTKNTDSCFSQIFRGWKVVQVKYQPLDDSDFEDLDPAFDDTEDTNTDDDETKPAENTNSATNTNGGGLVEPEDTNSAAE